MAPGQAAQGGPYASRAAALVPAAQEGPSSSSATAPGLAAQQPSNTQPQVSHLITCIAFLSLLVQSYSSFHANMQN